MGKKLGINERMGICGQENDTGSRENKPQYHYELHEYKVVLDVPSQMFVFDGCV